MRILVIGGTGFIGPPLVRRLVALGHEVASFYRGETQLQLPTGVESIRGDRHRLAEYVRDFRRFAPDVVVDMIAFTEDDARGLVETFRGLAQSTVVISSADVYRAYGRFIGLEEGPVEPTPLDERAPLRSTLFPYRRQSGGPDDFLYSYDKIPVEWVVLDVPDLPGTVVRLPMVHGPGDRQHRLAAYVRRMDEGRPAILLDEVMARWRCPRGEVGNVAAAIAQAVTDERAAGKVYNVAEPVAWTEAEWVAKIAKVVGWRGRVIAAPSGRIPVPYRVEQSLDTSSEQIRRELGYTEPVAPDEALKQAVIWERSQPGGGPVAPGLVDYATEDEILAELGLA
jgi:nucleoside-diphosphate-sugar epimerase